MSKFAAIEARCTQYPADANDVVWLVERVRELRSALEIAKRDIEYVASERQLISPLLVPGLRHRATEITEALASLNEPNVPVPS